MSEPRAPYGDPEKLPPPRPEPERPDVGVLREYLEKRALEESSGTASTPTPELGGTPPSSDSDGSPLPGQPKGSERGPGALLGLIQAGLIVRPERWHEEPFDLGDGVAFRKTPRWVYDRERNKFLSSANVVLLDNLGKTYFCLWVGTTRSLLNPVSGETDFKTDDATERLRKAGLAIWLSTIVSFDVPLLVPLAARPGHSEMVWDGLAHTARLTFRICPRSGVLSEPVLEESGRRGRRRSSAATRRNCLISPVQEP